MFILHLYEYIDFNFFEIILKLEFILNSDYTLRYHIKPCLFWNRGFILFYFC